MMKKTVDIAFQRDIAALTKIPNLFDMCLAGIFRTFIPGVLLKSLWNVAIMRE
jgi:hypothetical protein